MRDITSNIKTFLQEHIIKIIQPLMLGIIHNIKN